jgi:predicted small secreted protein
MKDIWFIFDKNGKFLFKTTNESRANINEISSNFNAKYIIKNPSGYDENKEQHISYNTSTTVVNFTETTTFEHVNSTNNETVDVEDLEILDYRELLTNLKDALNAINSLQNSVKILTDRLDNNSNTIGSALTNVE